MKVILLQNVEDLGKKYEVKDVKEGYARNFLLPEKLAKPATPEALKWLQDQKEIIAREAEEDLKKSQELASKIDGLEVTIPVKIGQGGQMFESINSQKISEALKDMGYEVKKSHIILDNPIKDLGEYPVKLSLDHNLESEIKIIISEQGSGSNPEED